MADVSKYRLVDTEVEHEDIIDARLRLLAVSMEILGAGFHPAKYMDLADELEGFLLRGAFHEETDGEASVDAFDEVAGNA